MAKLNLASTLLILALAFSVAANDLVFISGGACNLALPHIECDSWEQGGCCTAGTP